MITSFPKCDSSIYEMPMFDPLVASYLATASPYTDGSIKELDGNSIYAQMLKDKKDLIFLDIGASIGLISIYAAPACKRIIALEPAPEAFKVLKAMTLNQPNTECYDTALSPIDDNVGFYCNDVNPTASSTVNTYGTRITVRGLRLSSILRVYQLEHVDYAKIDAEGAEGESLSVDELKDARSVIQAMYIEFHNCPVTTWEHKMATISRRLFSVGYSKIKIVGGHRMAIYATK